MSTAYMQHELFDTALQGGKSKLGRLWNGYFLQFRISIYEIYGWASCDYREILNAKEGINFTKKNPTVKLKLLNICIPHVNTIAAIWIL